MCRPILQPPLVGQAGRGERPASLEGVCERWSSPSRMVRAIPHPRGDPRRVRARADRSRRHRVPGRPAGHPRGCRSAARRAGDDRTHPGSRGRRLRATGSRRPATRSRPSSRPSSPIATGLRSASWAAAPLSSPASRSRSTCPSDPAFIDRVLAEVADGTVRLGTATTRLGELRYIAAPVAIDDERGVFLIAVDLRAELADFNGAFGTYALVAAGALAIIGLVGLRDGRPAARADPPAAARGGGDHGDAARDPHPGGRARRRLGADRSP